MNKFIPWYEIYTFGSIGALFVAFATSITFAVPQLQGAALFSFWVATSIVVFISVFLIISKWLSGPDYVTQQKVAVWSDIREKNFVLPTLTDLDVILESFCERAIMVLKTLPDLTEAERAITREQLRRMLYGAKFLFTRCSSALDGIEWRVKDKGCSQRRKLLAVRYHSPFTTTAIFLGLWHMVNSEILHRAPDPDHTNLIFWRALDDIQAKIDSDIYQIRSNPNFP